MARVRKLTPDGDLEYVAGRQTAISGDLAHAQAVLVSIQTLLGENAYHPTLGIDLAAMSSPKASDRAAAIGSAATRSYRLTQIFSVQPISDPSKNRRYSFVLDGELVSGSRLNVGVNL